ncbi:hypothetical protein, partial [Kocuria sp. HSID16901]|uniref:hypothetical protein n=1 Tax=Kocuria sp. HSID16901 TaxID=2419505 RepID=UPI000F9DB7D7
VGHEGLLVREAVELNSSTSQPEALTSQLFTAVSPKQRPWTLHLAAANARVETLQTTEVERLAAEAGIVKPAAIWLSGMSLESVRDE